MKSLKIISTIICVFLAMNINAQQIGNASYYGKKFHGRRTSDGSRYHQDSLTCAHRTFDFGTFVKVRNIKNDSIVIVKVTDRGPHVRNRIIDLSYKAASKIDMVRAGIAKVEITKLKKEEIEQLQLEFWDNNVKALPIPKALLLVNSFGIKNFPIGNILKNPLIK